MPDGILVIDKPRDWTSMDVCAKLRGALGERRIGHCGTLDPMATGILVVFVGRATRAVEFTEGYDKEYEAALRLGLTTDTQDVTGRVLEERPAQVSREELEAALEGFRGSISQVPPMYSAVKVGGKKLYELARRGKEVERRPRQIQIHRLTLLGQGEEGDWLLRVSCSKGTYIRTLCHDIGQALGCGGTLSRLRRTRVGPFTRGIPLEEALRRAKEEGPQALLTPVEACFAQYPAFQTNPPQARSVYHGAAFPCTAQEGFYRVYGPEGAFLMLGKVQSGEMRTVKSFFPPPNQT